MNAGLLGFGAVTRDEALQGPCPGDRTFAKFMAKQDVMAVAAATKAMKQAGLSVEERRHDLGLYLTTCRLGFEDQEFTQLLDRSAPSGHFDIEAFSTKAFFGMRPTQTFKCLGYMPLFHIARTFGLHGRYFTNYPDSSQFLVSLRQAMLDLDAGTIRYALVGAVADRENVLARTMERNLGGPGPEAVRDGAAFLVLGPEGDARRIARCAMPRLDWRGSPDQPSCDGAHGCVEPLLALSEALARQTAHRYETTSSGVHAVWEVTP